MQLSTDKLKSLRNDKGWSQEVLAKASGLSARTIQRIEADGRASAESTLAIASVFNLSPKALMASSTEIKVNWTRKMIMKTLLALAVVSGAIGMLLYLAAGIHLFLDAPSLIYLLLFLYAVTIIIFGTDGMLKSLSGLKYLFTDEMVGGKQAVYLSKIFASQVKILYGGAAIGFFIGTIAILGNVDGIEDLLFYRGFAVNFIVFLYAAVLAESIFRPLAIKLKTCDLID